MSALRIGVTPSRNSENPCLHRVTERMVQAVEAAGGIVVTLDYPLNEAALEEVLPSLDGLILAGGASKSELWCQIVADVANLPVRIPEVADLACVGAAVLAGVGCGVYKDTKEGYKSLAVNERVIYPDPERAKEYAALFEEYKRIAGILGDAYNL